MPHQMISFDVPHGVDASYNKPRMLRSDLAQRFVELQRLRKKVSKLEKLLASDRRRIRVGPANLVGRPK
jgi:hypothetical protein